MCQAAYFNSVIYDDTRQRQCYVRPDASGCTLEARSREGRDANSTTRRYRQGNPAVKGDTAHLVAQLRFQLLEEVRRPWTWGVRVGQRGPRAAARSCSPPETRAIVATHMYSPVACQCGTSSINLPAIVLSQRSAGSAQSGATMI